jgi:hypothetical protein
MNTSVFPPMMTYISLPISPRRTIVSPGAKCRSVPISTTMRACAARRPAKSGIVRAGSSPSFTPRRSQSVMILVVESRAGRSTRFAPSEAAMVTPARMPKFWIGTKLERAKTRKPAKSAIVV